MKCLSDKIIETREAKIGIAKISKIERTNMDRRNKEYGTRDKLIMRRNKLIAEMIDEIPAK